MQGYIARPRNAVKGISCYSFAIVLLKSMHTFKTYILIPINISDNVVLPSCLLIIEFIYL